MSLTCRAKRAIVLGLIRMHISSVDRMKRASIPGWMVLRQLLHRSAFRAVVVLLPASLIGAFLSRRRSAVRTLASDTTDRRAGLGAELQSMEAAMLRIAGELGDCGLERMDQALRA